MCSGGVHSYSWGAHPPSEVVSVRQMPTHLHRGTPSLASAEVSRRLSAPPPKHLPSCLCNLPLWSPACRLGAGSQPTCPLAGSDWSAAARARTSAACLSLQRSRGKKQRFNESLWSPKVTVEAGKRGFQTCRDVSSSKRSGGHRSDCWKRHQSEPKTLNPADKTLISTL